MAPVIVSGKIEEVRGLTDGTALLLIRVPISSARDAAAAYLLRENIQITFQPMPTLDERVAGMKGKVPPR